ncbi:hypothetical protein AAL_02314 [Moelleriella libera RCEF 2490]|uniref:Uncharacterized protein n=1 Tax=Moelleriella libera RCEF 2490 TaxID=1081109 RepID=A0A168EG76_9HYPO|nr:hypothetical protein AAL_02314 [Moelleriella libera RCEF 2490]
MRFAFLCLTGPAAANAARVSPRQCNDATCASEWLSLKAGQPAENPELEENVDKMGSSADVCSKVSGLPKDLESEYSVYMPEHLNWLNHVCDVFGKCDSSKVKEKLEEGKDPRRALHSTQATAHKLLLLATDKLLLTSVEPAHYTSKIASSTRGGRIAPTNSAQATSTSSQLATSTKSCLAAPERGMVVAAVAAVAGVALTAL